MNMALEYHTQLEKQYRVYDYPGSLHVDHLDTSIYWIRFEWRLYRASYFSL